MDFGMRQQRILRDRTTLKKFVFRLGHIILLPLALPVLVVFSLGIRRVTVGRQKTKNKPRLVYGPIPIISIKYMSQAMEQLGYEARTVVYDVYRLHTRSDYNHYIGDFFRNRLMHQVGFIRLLFFAFLARYFLFIWLLMHFDIFHYFFDGGFLKGTSLRFLEVQLLHLARKKVIVMPYGSDVTDLIHFRSLVFRHGILAQYPGIIFRQQAIAKQIKYFSEHADFIIGAGWLVDSMPRWDLLTSHYYPIDTDAWAPGDYWSNADGKNGEVTIFHSPNHRWLKGTEFLKAACQELEREGYKIRLVIAEGAPNTEVRRSLASSDILAEQFGMPWYGLNAMEGMSLAKPVLSDLSDKYYTELFFRYTGLDECPIVNTSIGQIKDHLRMLITNPELRRQIGEAGRRYVVKYHSYQTVARMWELIYRKVWYGEDIDLAVWHPDRFLDR
jgi:glycosyltransferase involved in cell wall biosynthesis